MRLALPAALAIMALAACAKLAPPDPNMTAIRARFGQAQLTWVTRRVVGGQAVACGYAGPPRHAQVFIARAGKLFLPADLPAGQFDHWEDDLCGDNWIKPLNL
jgi:hypothetical protein